MESSSSSGTAASSTKKTSLWLVSAGHPVDAEMYAPLVPLYVLLSDQSPQVGGKGSTGESDCEFSALIDGIPLGLDDEVGEGVCGGQRGRGGVQRRRDAPTRTSVSGKL